MTDTPSFLNNGLMATGASLPLECQTQQIFRNWPMAGFSNMRKVPYLYGKVY